MFSGVRIAENGRLSGIRSVELIRAADLPVRSRAPARRGRIHGYGEAVPFEGDA